MRKKLISLILGVIVFCSLFAGCALIEHNDVKDARQVVATVDAIEDGSFKSAKKNIYKSDLISMLNQYGQSYMQNYNLTLEQTVDRLLDELITRELLLVEADRLLAQGKIQWTQKEENQKLEYIYSSLDNLISSFRNEILSDRGESSSSSSDEENSDSETTYPTPDAETTEDDYKYYQFDKDGNPIYEEDKFDKDGNPLPKYIVWAPEESSYPCLWGDEDKKSLDREAVNRVLLRLKDLVDDDFKVTKEDKKLFEQDDKEIENVRNTKGIEAVYPMLGKTHYLEYIVGTSARQSIMLSLLQEYITEDVTVTDDEVTDAYNSEVRNQYDSYRDNQSAYQTAVTDGKTTILYQRDDSYFWVKHILLPFSDKQKADFEALKKDPANAGKDFTEIRDTQMVNEAVVYPHVDGEDDKSHPMKIKDVYNEVIAKMSPVAGNAYEAERTFDELIYKYSTDPGSFGYGKLYAVKRNDDTGHSGYMEEFYDGAMELYNNPEYKVGSVLPKYVVTDYGVHIMYFAMEATPGKILQLDDFTTPGRYESTKIRKTFEDTIKTAKENSAFDTWSAERIRYYQDNEKVVHRFRKRFKSLYED